MQISGGGRADQLAKIILGVQPTNGPAASRAATQNGPGKDRVQISEQAKELARIRALGQEPDHEREARVERIKQSIDTGTYNVSGRKVGDAVIKQVLTDAVL